MLDFATCTECGRCQSSCPAWTTGKPLSPKLLIMGLRDNMFASADRLLSGELERRSRDAGADDDRSRRAVVVHDVRRLRRAVPGRHRARRRDHRHAPLRGHDGVAVPDRGRTAAAQHGEPGRPVGTRFVQAHRVARPRSTSRCRSSRARSPTTSSTSTGWAVPARSTSAAASRSISTRAHAAPRRGHVRASSARASPAPATPRGAWATSTSSRRWPRPTSRRSTRSARRRSWRAVRTASTR